ncbi:hypothetical protein ACTFIR_002552 [Dictyostelium discoideum]
MNNDIILDNNNNKCTHHRNNNNQNNKNNINIIENNNNSINNNNINNNNVVNNNNEKLKIEIDENNFKFIMENYEFSNYKDIKSIAFGEDCGSLLKFKSKTNLISVMLLDGFKESLEPGILPNSIRYLEIYDIKTPLLVGSIPSTIINLILHDGFNQSLEPGIIPSNQGNNGNNERIVSFLPTGGVQNLTLHNIKSELNIGSIPGSVGQLALNDGFSQTLKPGIIPKTALTNYLQQVLSEGVQRLVFHQVKDLLIVGSIPKSIHSLFFENGFNQIISPGIITNGVSKLVLGEIKQPLLVNSIPNSVINLHITIRFNQALTPGIITNSIKILTLDTVNIQLVEGSIPKTIQKIILNGNIELSSLDVCKLDKSVQIIKRDY